MKRIILLLLAIPIAFSSFAQEQKDSISVPSTPQIDPCEQIFARYNKLVEESFVYKHRVDSLSQQVERLQKELKERLAHTDDLQKQQSTYKRDLAQCSSELKGIKDANSRLEKEISDRNKKLENIATNFIYIPYEDFSIQEVAVPAIESLDGNYSSLEIGVKADLLKHYREDFKSLLEFFKSTYKTPKVNSANEFQENLIAFEKLELIKRYESYEDCQNTFIGKIIEEVRKPLRSLSKKGLPPREEGPNFYGIITQLESCINTIPKNE